MEGSSFVKETAPRFANMETRMIHYLELPYSRCKRCKHFDPTSAKAYTKCFHDAECPAKYVQLVIRDSVNTLAKKYIEASKVSDFDALRKILSEAQSRGKGFEYKFKREVQTLRQKEQQPVKRKKSPSLGTVVG